MDTITFYDPETQEEVELYVIEQTVLAGNSYLLATEAAEEDAEAYILRKTEDVSDSEAAYEFVTDEKELEVIAKVFSELVEDIDIEV